MLARLDNSVIFKKLFTDREVLQAFVKDVTGATIDPETIETEKSFAPPSARWTSRSIFSRTIRRIA